MRGGNEVAVFVTRRQGSEILVCKRCEALGGYWHTIAGGREPGETSAAAAARELEEETTLAATVRGPITSYIYRLDEEPPERRALYTPGIRGMHVDCFLVEAPDGWEPELDHEHDTCRWCAPADALALLHWADTADALRQVLKSTDG
ncbi:MAG: NUDIX domain-containing protein [Gaiellaceae bacterium]